MTILKYCTIIFTGKEGISAPSLGGGVNTSFSNDNNSDATDNSKQEVTRSRMFSTSIKDKGKGTESIGGSSSGPK